MFNLVTCLDSPDSNLPLRCTGGIWILSDDEFFFVELFADTIESRLWADLQSLHFDVPVERAGVFGLCLVVIVGEPYLKLEDLVLFGTVGLRIREGEETRARA